MSNVVPRLRVSAIPPATVEFQNALILRISEALGISYEQLAEDYSQILESAIKGERASPSLMVRVLNNR